MEFDLTPDLNKPPKRKYWQPPSFGVGENERNGLSGSGVIFDGRQLQIYVRQVKKVFVSLTSFSFFISFTAAGYTDCMDYTFSSLPPVK